MEKEKALAMLDSPGFLHCAPRRTQLHWSGNVMTTRQYHDLVSESNVTVSVQCDERIDQLIRTLQRERASCLANDN